MKSQRSVSVQAYFMDVSDPQLLDRIAHGDRDAFSEFYDRHAARVFGLLVKLMRDRTEAEDVLQETFCQSWVSAGRYDPSRATPSVWLLLIARSRAIEHFRRQKRRTTMPMESVGEPETDMDVVGQVGILESSESVRKLMGELPEEQSSAIRLAFYDGLTHEQIAERQRIPLGTVKTRIRLGMRRLRGLLQFKEDAA